MTQENVAASVSIGRGQQALTACEDGTADAGQTEFAVQAAIEDVRNELLGLPNGPTAYGVSANPASGGAKR